MAATGNFEINFLKNENLFQRNGAPFLIKNTKTDKATYTYQTALPEANVKTNRMGRTNGPITSSS